MLNKKIPGFTMAELLVTMALTSLLVSFAYMGFNYIDRLLKQYREQSHFINQLSELKTRLNLLSSLPGTITKENENTFVFKTDSSVSHLKLKTEYVLLERFNRTDTFLLKPTDTKTSFETMNHTEWRNRLINQIEFDIYFQKQKFHLIFSKKYDAFTKLELEKENN
jgi:prepilin-type N-terminal cleavage/methylation domain-containing protein